VLLDVVADVVDVPEVVSAQALATTLFAGAGDGVPVPA